MIYTRQKSVPGKLAQYKKDIQELSSIQTMGRDIWRPKINTVSDDPYDVVIPLLGFFAYDVFFSALSQQQPYAKVLIKASSSPDMSDDADIDFSVQLRLLDSIQHDGRFQWLVNLGNNIVPNAYVKFYIYATDFGEVTYAPA